MRTTSPLRSLGWWAAAIGLVLLAAPEPMAAQSGRAHVDTGVAAAIARGGDAPTRVVARVAPGARAALTAKWRGQGHRVVREHPGISAVTLELPAKALDALAREDGVLGVSLDAPVKSHSDSGVPVSGVLVAQTLGLGTSAGLTGAGVGVGIVDSGIMKTADFDTRIAAF
ncbi:MAG: hypothetical protein HY655_12485, partial [Acidobacteria bacterium]|nr:hypothetical protein [Acidobacteriota bacterium]